MKHVNKHLNVNLLGPNCYDFFKNFFYVTVVLGPFKANCFPFMLNVKEISMVLKKKKNLHPTFHHCLCTVLGLVCAGAPNCL